MKKEQKKREACNDALAFSQLLNNKKLSRLI